ncbi:hypothetical protein RB195_017470 [Necator americanus]|uniref:Uncharacterized protein n=1 Tax=Necator americanus TaxID=51031 RepID=A0ABR1C5E8_NECAM
MASVDVEQLREDGKDKAIPLLIAQKMPPPQRRHMVTRADSIQAGHHRKANATLLAVRVVLVSGRTGEVAVWL